MNTERRVLNLFISTFIEVGTESALKLTLMMINRCRLAEIWCITTAILPLPDTPHHIRHLANSLPSKRPGSRWISEIEANYGRDTYIETNEMVISILLPPAALGVTFVLGGLYVIFNPESFYRLFGLIPPVNSTQAKNRNRDHGQSQTQILVPLIGARSLLLGLILSYNSIIGRTDVVSNILLFLTILAGVDMYVAIVYGAKRGWVSHAVGGGVSGLYGWWLGTV